MLKLTMRKSARSLFRVPLSLILEMGELETTGDLTGPVQVFFTAEGLAEIRRAQFLIRLIIQACLPVLI
jgi:hypothetical protein